MPPERFSFRFVLRRRLKLLIYFRARPFFAACRFTGFRFFGGADDGRGAHDAQADREISLSA